MPASKINASVPLESAGELVADDMIISKPLEVAIWQNRVQVTMEVPDGTGQWVKIIRYITHAEAKDLAGRLTRLAK